MWFFSKKETLQPTKGPNEIGRWLIPVENLEEIYKLHWEMMSERGHNLLATYKFWEAIRKIVPKELLEQNPRLVFESTNCTLVSYVVFYNE